MRRASSTSLSVAHLATPVGTLAETEKSGARQESQQVNSDAVTSNAPLLCKSNKTKLNRTRHLVVVLKRSLGGPLHFSYPVSSLYLSNACMNRRRRAGSGRFATLEKVIV